MVRLGDAQDLSSQRSARAHSATRGGACAPRTKKPHGVSTGRLLDVTWIRCGLRGGLRGGSGLLFEGLLCLRDDGGEGSGVGDREIREDLAVGLDAGGLQSLDEAGVGDSLGTDGGVDTLSPETAELPFAALAVAVFVLLRFADGVLGVTEELRAETAEALGPQDRALAARTAGGRICRSWQCVLWL